MKVRALRNERRMGIGNWTSDLHKGHVYDVPDAVGETLVATDAAITVDDSATDDPWFDAETA